MQTLIVYRSRHGGNTKEVVEVMAEVLEAELRKPEGLSSEDLENYDLIGFGSGIYFREHDEKLLNFVEGLPEMNGKKAFIISTSGLPKIPLLHDFEGPLRKRLERKNFEVLDSFDCRGVDFYNLFKYMGGIDKGKPDKEDLGAARKFAEKLVEKCETDD